MSDLVPFEYSENRSYDGQMRDALEKALTIQGTVVSDLESAINCILQMERALNMLGGINPHQATAVYLKNKYKMTYGAANKTTTEARKLLNAGEQRCKAPHCWSEYGTPCGECPVPELLEGEVVDNG